MIFTAQLMMLRDENFSGAMGEAIRAGSHPLEAVQSVTDRYCRLFAASPNPRLQEKAQDVTDLGHRLKDLLLHNNQDDHHAAYQDAIIIAHDLLPSDILKLSIQGAEGLVLTGSGMTAHVAILARSLHLPMIIAQSTGLIKPGIPLLLDAHQGTLFIDPDDEIQAHYAAQKEAAGTAGQIGEQVQPETFTLDGTRIHLLANINLLSELNGARDLKAEGIGLYRTEFPFLIRSTFPSEEEQCRIYQRVFEGLKDKPVTFRTLDIGGDKMLSYFPQSNESNPFLGLRAIRFSLRHRDIFRQQLNALLRAGHERDLRIMFPLIASVDDFVQAREIVEDCLAELAERGEPHNASPHVGAMIELPSAVAMAGDLAREADFLSIGTNDLVQYVLAVDRTNEQLSEWYQHHHPAVLRALAWIARAARKHTRLSICGDMASDPTLLPFLVGIGLRAFSMTPHAIPAAQQSLRKINVTEAQQLAQRLLTMNRLQDIATELGTTAARPT